MANKSRPEPGSSRRAVSRAFIASGVVIIVVVAGASAYLIGVGASPKSGPGSLAASLVISVVPDPVLMAPGQTQTYPSLEFQWLGPTLSGPVALSAMGPAGLSPTLAEASISSANQGSAPTLVPLTLASSSSLRPGLYNITVKAVAGHLSENQTFEVRVVAYLVMVQGVKFSPANLTVPTSTTVYWLNLDSNIGCCDPGYHNVVFKSGTSASSPTLKRIDSWSYQFNAAGEFDYICSIHPWMVGRITVAQ